jgi:PD-(D/E)XK nuclease superfamily
MTDAVSPSYKSAILKMVRQRSLELEELQRHWPSLENKLTRQRRRRSDKINPDDPIRLGVDLLSPIGRISDETIHTRALAYLLDPEPVIPHGFGKDVLAAILDKLPRGRGASQISKLLRGRRPIVTVTAEYRYREEGMPDRSVSRCDIWVTLKSKKHAALIIIENKINALEGPSQLTWYQDKACEWCKNHAPSKSLLLYLTPDGRQPKSSNSSKWLVLSYLDLASALRRAWLQKPKAVGRPWLALYIATITSGILGMDITKLQDDDIKAYIGKHFDAKRKGEHTCNLSRA